MSKTTISKSLLSTKELPQHSISRWENSLAVSDQQVKMLTTSNEQLRMNITLLEAEMQELSNALLNKEAQIHGKEREVKKKNDEIRKLVALEQQDKGKERAIEMASTQNGQLLALLDIHEARSKKLSEEKAKLIDELKDSNDIHVKHVQKASNIESQLRSQLSTLQKEHKSLRNEHFLLVEKHNGFEQTVIDTKRTCKVSVAVVEEELSMRRDSQYGSLVKVQALEDQLRKAQDMAEAHQSQYLTFVQRTAELEERLDSLMQTLFSKDEHMAQVMRSHASEIDNLTSELSSKEEIENTLRFSMSELSSSLLKVVSKNHELAASLETKTQQLAANKIKLSDARATAKDETVRRSKTAEVYDHHILNRLLAELFDQAGTLELKSSQHRLIEPKSPREVSRSRDSGRSAKMLAQYLRFVGSLHTEVVSGGPKLMQLPKSLILSLMLEDCQLVDEDMPTFVKFCESCNKLDTVMLKSNQLSDASISQLKILIDILPNLKLLDLQDNRLSMDGIRELALFLESNQQRNVGHVYIHQDGRLEVLGVVGPDHSPETILIIDVRLNFSLDALPHSRTSKLSKSKGKQRVDSSLPLISC